MEVSIFWFRRDLRLNDNTGLNELIKRSKNILLLFIFDENIISKLNPEDRRLHFIYSRLKKMYAEVNSIGFKIIHGTPERIFKELYKKHHINHIYFNSDYEPYARERDKVIFNLANKYTTEFMGFKDQVIFHKKEILKDDGTPYKVFTAYKNKWLKSYRVINTETNQSDVQPHLIAEKFEFPENEYFETKNDDFLEINLDSIDDYDKNRDYPAINGTSKLGTHLRFGTVSIRDIVAFAFDQNAIFLSELIWREFFMMILYFYPKNSVENFKPKFDGFPYENNNELFEKWKSGDTGYPIVDAGMRELNTTGFMHNRVRMVCASFLCKHLLINYKWGEAYFAEKLLDFDLSANNGNWQWCAGSGVDAAPYFRIFNPTRQQERFDKSFDYVKKWVPEYLSNSYKPIIDHTFARNRALEAYNTIR